MKRLARAIGFLPMILVTGIAFAQEIRVTVQGAVRRPGSYLVDKGERLSSLIERGGGYADNADYRAATLLRASARPLQEQALKAALARLEALPCGTPADTDEIRRFFDALERLEPRGRVPVRLDHPRLLKGTENDLPLEDGDTLTIPGKTNDVTVTGALRSPSPVLLPHAGGKGYREFIERAGGFSDDADRDGAYIYRKDGSTRPLAREWIRWNPAEARWEIPAFREGPPPVEPGDTIVVPKRPACEGWGRNIEELRRLLMRIHAIAGESVRVP